MAGLGTNSQPFCCSYQIQIASASQVTHIIFVTQIIHSLTLMPPLFFVLKILSAEYIQLHFRLSSLMETNNMNPVQIAYLGAF